MRKTTDGAADDVEDERDHADGVVDEKKNCRGAMGEKIAEEMMKNRSSMWSAERRANKREK